MCIYITNNLCKWRLGTRGADVLQTKNWGGPAYNTLNTINIPSSPAYGVFIYQLIRYVRACSSYECFILRATRLSSKIYSNRDTSRNACNHHSGSFMVVTGILFSNMKYPSHECQMTFWYLTNSDFPTNQTFHQFHDLYTELDLHRLWVVSIEHLQRVWHASRERLPFRTPGSVPHCGTCLCSNCWDHILWTCHSLLDFSPRIPLGTFSILHYSQRKITSIVNFLIKHEILHIASSWCN